ncbi:hypothetical protein [Streptomyces sp. NPDC059256]|uniref:hypothetical protein n=1 Tax=Streptomyces sp. NPDC059256 TaxID=3346794 RepID=UPI0036C2B423
MNGEQNLLLLCPKHHKWVDDFQDDYTVEDLPEWKQRQVAQGRSVSLTEAQIELVFLAFTTPKAEVDVVGVIRVDGDGITSKIESFPKVKPVNAQSEERFLGVRVSNVGAIGSGVDGVGIEIDVDDPTLLPYWFPAEHGFHRPPQHLEAQANGVWLENPLSVVAGIQQGLIPRGWVPVRFRAFVDLGSGDRTVGAGVQAVHLPIWEEHVTHEWLISLAETAKQVRAASESPAP